MKVYHYQDLLKEFPYIQDLCPDEKEYQFNYERGQVMTVFERDEHNIMTVQACLVEHFEDMCDFANILHTYIEIKVRHISMGNPLVYCFEITGETSAVKQIIHKFGLAEDLPC